MTNHTIRSEHKIDDIEEMNIEGLLETAKRAVEIAIEQDEEAAMRYIDEAQRAST